MSELRVRNDSITTIQVKFNNEEAQNIPPGRFRETTEIGEFSVIKSNREVFRGEFSGIADVRIHAEQTHVNARFTVKNDHHDDNLQIVVIRGAHVDRIESHKSIEFKSPGKYTMSFPERNSDGSESLRAIVFFEFPIDVDNVMMHIS